jgi:hypothetical protein
VCALAGLAKQAINELGYASVDTSTSSGVGARGSNGTRASTSVDASTRGRPGASRNLVFDPGTRDRTRQHRTSAGPGIAGLAEQFQTLASEPLQPQRHDTTTTLADIGTQHNLADSRRDGRVFKQLTCASDGFPLELATPDRPLYTIASDEHERAGLPRRRAPNFGDDDTDHHGLAIQEPNEGRHPISR